MQQISQNGYLNNSRYISIEKLLMFLLLSSSVLGVVASYHKLYLFHIIVLLFFISFLTGYLKIRRSSISSIKYLLIFLIYTLITLTWTPNIKNGLTYFFYLICGVSLVFLMVNYSRDLNKLKFIFKVLSVFFLLNFTIGLFETTGKFRLPGSPYSDMSNINVYIDLTRPASFHYNSNNFGFVFILIFPYLILHPKKWVRYLSTLLMIWFTLKLQSKGFFIAVLLFPLFYLLIEIKKKSTWIRLFLFSSLIIIFTFFLTTFINQVQLDNRVFSSFEQIKKGVEIIQSGDVGTKDSTGVRAGIYLYGLERLFSSYGIGLGLAGIGTELALNTDFFDSESTIYSFHSFFLEVLIDLGVLPFLFIMYCYANMIFKNIKISHSSDLSSVRYFSRATALSLLLAIPASISPSSIIYILPFWLVIGFSISINKMYFSKLKS